MSKVSNVYDGFITSIGTSLSTYVRIPNPYEAGENPSLYMRKGFGVAFGPAFNTNRQICEKVSIMRNFVVVLINQYVSMETDSSSKGSAEKALLEDQLTMMKSIDGSVTLGQLCSQVRYVSDTGIEFVSTEDDAFIMTEVTFEVEYLETY